jgi:dethiobiotin synthetase
MSDTPSAPDTPPRRDDTRPDILVTGTDTGIGKTTIAAAFIKALRARGVRAIGFKPLETGTPSFEEVQSPDSYLLARASGETTPLVTPLLQLAEPLAPAVAAERAGIAIRPEEIEERIDLLRRAGYTLVVEGAGGVMVPLAWEHEISPRPFYTIIDLAAHCRLDAIVVARLGLGTLNHIALTVAMLRSRNVPVKAVILNGRGPKAHSPEPKAQSPEPDLAEITNPAALARMLPGVLIIDVPRHDARDHHDARDRLATIDATVPYLTPLLP